MKHHRKSLIFQGRNVEEKRTWKLLRCNDGQLWRIRTLTELINKDLGLHGDGKVILLYKMRNQNGKLWENVSATFQKAAYKIETATLKKKSTS